MKFQQENEDFKELSEEELKKLDIHRFKKMFSKTHCQTMGLMDCAAYLGIGRQALRKMVEEKEIPHMYIGKRIMFDKDIIGDWIESKTIGGHFKKEDIEMLVAALKFYADINVYKCDKGKVKEISTYSFFEDGEKPRRAGYLEAGWYAYAALCSVYGKENVCSEGPWLDAMLRLPERRFPEMDKYHKEVFRDFEHSVTVDQSE